MASRRTSSLKQPSTTNQDRCCVSSLPPFFGYTCSQYTFVNFCFACFFFVVTLLEEVLVGISDVEIQFEVVVDTLGAVILMLFCGG